MIINVVGTPTVEEIYHISKAKSREEVFKLGKIAPKKFADLFPKANPDGKIKLLF